MPEDELVSIFTLNADCFSDERHRASVDRKKKKTPIDTDFLLKMHGFIEETVTASTRSSGNMRATRENIMKDCAALSFVFGADAARGGYWWNQL